MRFYFSIRTTVVCLALAVGMSRASYWQYERYIGKQEYIKTMAARLAEPPISLTTVLHASSPDWRSMSYRRIQVTGEFDFAHEVVLRNRRLGEISGVFVLTPLRVTGLEPPTYVLVSRGFIPLLKSGREERKEFQRPTHLSFTALAKESAYQKFLAPKDPPSGSGHPWVDQWLRVDIPKIEAQLPYKLLPIYLEIMETPDGKGVQEQILDSRGGREEMFYLGENHALPELNDIPDQTYPVPVYDSVIPPGRHFGYIFEWAGMALATILVGILLQLRPPRSRVILDESSSPAS